MLKIKDSVDLKELEKFGFEARYDEKTGELKKMTYDLKDKTVMSEITITPNCEYEKRHLIFKKICYRTMMGFAYPITANNKAMDIIYNLTQAGLIEKVEE